MSAFYRRLLSLCCLVLLAGTAQAQYCTPTYGSLCSSGDYINGFSTTGGSTNISNLNNGCNGNTNNYIFYNTMTCTAMQGVTVNFSIFNCPSWTQGQKIYVDWNGNNSFSDPGELVYNPTSTVPGGGTGTGSFMVPVNAVPGTTRMRVRCAYNTVAFDDCNNQSFGETEDYNFVVVAAPPCSGTPVISSITPAGPINSCAGASVTLTPTMATIASGYTYQWQSGTSCTGPWTNITGATNYSYAFTVAGSNYYRLAVTCTASSLTGYSACVQVTATSPVYATIPYFQDFESWSNYCGTSDIPSSNWTNQPATGDLSWRRNDQGSTASWQYATSGTYSPTSKSGTYSARFHSYGASYTPPYTNPGNLDLYLNCGAATGGKMLSFYMINSNTYLYDSLSLMLSTDGGTSFSQIAGFRDFNSWTKLLVPIASNSATTILRFKARLATNTYDYSDIGIDSVYVAGPCTGQPVAGFVSPSGVQTGCPGTSYTLSANGTTLAGNFAYQWEQKTLTNPVWTPATGPTATTMNYTTPLLTDTIYYRLKVTCLGSNLSAYTDSVLFNVPKVVYGTLPFTESFENWASRCSTTDIPSVSWSNTPNSGNNAWRRNDQGASASWTSPATGMYAPVAAVGNSSARFHAYYAPTASQGNLDAYINCSSYIGTKELSFYLNMNTSLYAYDTLTVQYSTDGGATFTSLATYTTPATGTWQYKTLSLPSNSATTVVRFRAKMYFSYMTYYNDFGIDYVRVLPPCSGKPTAGTVNVVPPCPNANFNLTLAGNTQAAGITYQWQKLVSGSWVTGSIVNATSLIAQDNINTPTYYRCIVTCTNSSAPNVDTTPAYLVNLASFYYCYCAGGGTYSTYTNNIGNVTILKQPSGDTVLNNGIATPLQNNPNAGNLYTSFVYTVPPKNLYLDSLYRIYVTEINTNGFYTCTATAFIDYNHNGVFDPATERLFSKVTATPSQQVNDTFRVPGTSLTGITGMRVVLNQTTSTVNPCGSFSYGEVEDYLVNVNYPPCTGSVSAGTALTTDTAMCLNYYFTLTDTTHESHKSGIVWVWQQSVTNGNTWTDVANSTGKDTLTRLFTGSSWYRLRIICTNSGDTSYSNVVKVNLKPPYKCYCYSIATGGVLNDTSDVGAFSIGSFTTNTGGPHLRNPQATMGRTDYTDLGPIELYIDSTYEVDVYHILKNAYHGDARITLFMDFNNNLQYDIPQEAIYLTTTNPAIDWKSTVTNWYVINHIKIPHAAIPNVPTGMRLIINNDVAPNVPSETACGPYVSGETEDYTVMFRVGYPQGVAEISGLENLALYPNPTSGQFTVSFTAQNQLKDVAITITDVTGRMIRQNVYGDVNGGFKTGLDLTEQARGVYFVEIKANDQKIVKRVVVK